MRISDEVIKEHGLYKRLQENLDEAIDYIRYIDDINSQLSTDLDYMRSFIWYKGLEDEYDYFQRHAHPDESEDLPFPHYIL